MDLYRKYDIIIRKEDAEKAQKILDDLEEAREIDASYLSRWDEDTVMCSFAPIVSDDIPMIINKLIKNGIHII